VSTPIEIKCVRCHETLQFIGYRRLELDPIALKQLLNASVKLDFYKCEVCGHVELFQADTGRDMRPRELEEDEQTREREFDPDKGDYDYRGF
jgi:hypothetical protein